MAFGDPSSGSKNAFGGWASPEPAGVRGGTNKGGKGLEEKREGKRKKLRGEGREG